MANFDATRYDSTVIRQHALQFDTQVFESQLQAFISEKAQAHYA
jgi:hypothetical protein